MILRKIKIIMKFLLPLFCRSDWMVKMFIPFLDINYMSFRWLCPAQSWTGGCWRGWMSHISSIAKASAIKEGTCPCSWYSVWASAHQWPDGTLCPMVSKAAKTPASSKHAACATAPKHIQNRYCIRSGTPEDTKTWICHYIKPCLTFSICAKYYA